MICTVHYRLKYWPKIQDHYLQKHTKSPFKVIAFTSTDIESSLPTNWVKIRDSGIKSHSAKLNIAGDIAYQLANDDDILVFIDSDCFPIANWCDQISEQLDKESIAAVQRIENDGDQQPHPCFACMKAKTWKLIKGDWSMGYKWQNSKGDLVTDVGGNMLQFINKEKISWHKIHRSNTFNPHPLFFGIYGDIIYHHGAGSRAPISRADLRELQDEYQACIKMGNDPETINQERTAKNLEMSNYYFKKIINGDNLLDVFCHKQSR